VGLAAELKGRREEPNMFAAVAAEVQDLTRTSTTTKSTTTKSTTVTFTTSTLTSTTMACHAGPRCAANCTLNNGPCAKTHWDPARYGTAANFREKERGQRCSECCCMSLDEAAPEIRAAADATLLCQGPGACGGPHGMKRWDESPMELADQTGDFLTGLRGVGREVYEKVRDTWLSDPPVFHGTPVTLHDIRDFATETLRSDPFGTGDEVPFVNLAERGDKQVLAITQRQLAFVTVNALMGNSIEGGDGLTKHLKLCTGAGPTEEAKTTTTRPRTTSDPEEKSNMEDFVSGEVWGLLNRARNSTIVLRKLQQRRLQAPTRQLHDSSHHYSDIVFSLLSLLAVLSRELAGGKAGTFLIAARPSGFSDAWRSKLGTTLGDPAVCMKVAGQKQCETPDFMSGGVPFQAMTDIAGGAIGGGASLCKTAMSQDESLVQFYSDVLALAFFAQSHSGMLGVPMTILGARRYLNDLTGETGLGAPHYGSCGNIAQKDWLNQDIPTKSASVRLGERHVEVAASAFVAVASLSTDAFAGGSCSQGDLINNNCDKQRRHLDEDIARWYQAYEPTMYHDSVREAIRAIVKRVGTGPWGAGVWHGDSQQYFLATWIAMSLVAGGSLGFDYYIYDNFCENSGNQCFVLGTSTFCHDCIAGGMGAHYGVNPGRCGYENIWGMIGKAKGKPASALYNALKNAPGPPTQLFDGIKTVR